MVKVKICGITNLEDALASVDAGCDALGFIFYKKSPRYISPWKAREVIERLPKNVTKIGVFVNAKEKRIKNIAKLCNLDILQFHGNETAEFCKRFYNYKIIKAFRLRNKIDLTKVLRYQTFAYLFDTFVKSKFGGTGKKFNWKLFDYLEGLNKPIFISGGLNKKNVLKAMQIIRPDWVDVSSSVEIRPGKKDQGKVKEFIRVAKAKTES